MTKKIIVLHARECWDALAMMPFLRMLQFSKQFEFEFHDMWHDKDASEIKERYKPLLEKTGKPDAVPIFIDLSKQEAKFIPNIEGFMTWAAGPRWWEK